ncbi:unnamed protein product [Leptosia nina]|uniref:Peptidase S1 domain-containing protein n=1 Tax=Leptosia nina TaxID=320188 RepID=A0AAV1IYN9_9NEOP
MKGFIFVILCAIAVVKGRSFSAQDEAVSVPWLVHLRLARFSGNGRLDSCVGTIYNNRYVLTAASCLTEFTQGSSTDTRYFWIRYDAQNVFRPGFVTETSKVKIHPDYNPRTGENNIGLVDLDREIQFTDKIQPLAVASSDVALPESGKVCGYGEKDGNPGEDLQCVDARVYKYDGLIAAFSDGKATKYDIGAALVADNKVHGILIREADEIFAGTFLPTSQYIKWLEEATSPSDPKADDGSFDDAEEILVVEPVNIGSPDLFVGDF